LEQKCHEMYARNPILTEKSPYPDGKIGYDLS
jgi:hypothetical protein